MAEMPTVSQTETDFPRLFASILRPIPTVTGDRPFFLLKPLQYSGARQVDEPLIPSLHKTLRSVASRGKWLLGFDCNSDHSIKGVPFGGGNTLRSLYSTYHGNAEQVNTCVRLIRNETRL